ncbi:DNA-directed DNA polymerase [Sphaerisporangium melleum]|uniref:DNA-directed DNA polymerase n=1 Tax=Sphaerisporangium melleum TaxID=321316 RepID=A0A917RH28_9ACTN|nr:DNA polymerase III subunit alpha [Sphaerisporangium melleum]GGL06774.1 DNA-directed DNA polymerase [Sphaerisporangium melleum]GII74237.1 DNA-directed DNA polymerase [Sphaerisporangium melleum]
MFTHLHVASAYSLRYGTAFPGELVARAAGHEMDILALTDRDGMYGAVKHIQACADAGVRPVVGADFALSATEGEHAPSRGPAGEESAEQRITVLARNGGWRHLCRLTTDAHQAGRRGEPHVTRELVARHAEGLVVMLGPRSDVGRAVAARRDQHARVLLAAWRRAVPDLVVEVVDHYGHHESATAARMLALAKAMHVPAVLTNAVRHLDPGDYRVGDVLDAARKLVPLHPRHVEHSASHAYLKSGKEMVQAAARVCGGDSGRAARLLAETRRVAERCAFDPRDVLALRAEPERLHLPEVDGDAVALLRRRCEDGLAHRGLERSGQARERLADELRVIERKRLSGYFVAVSGITDLIRGMGVRCAIRGSGAGSLVNYLIRIGEVDPLDHGLLMERFLSEGRKGLPDIDIDVESARRLDCYQAILDRYGESRVACVSMMETYRARSAIRDVGAAMGLPPHETDLIAKAFPHIRARQIRAALSDLPELRGSGLDDRSLDTVFRLAERLDGLPRHIALHPCGVLVGNSGLRDLTPVERSMLDFPMSQFDKDDVEEAGLLKLDVLGVRMQSALAYALDEIKRVDDQDIDLEQDVPRDDPATYDMICTGHTIGCFQIESPGQRELVAKLEPRTMHDLIVDISLFRPGPVNSDMVTPYLEARHGWREPSYPHPRLRPALRETNGVVVFHEQVLRVVDVMTGCGLSEAERVRRALGDPASRERVRGWWEAAVLPEFDRETTDRAWQVLDAFGSFGFCKAHAAAFALPTYQSAWLKRHHPAAFLAGVLTHDPGMYPGRVILDEARKCGVAVLPLDVNGSGRHWLVERPPPAEPREATKVRESMETREAGNPLEIRGPQEAAETPEALEVVKPLATGDDRDVVEGFSEGYGLRVPFSAVKGISEAEVERMVAGQPYTSLADFWERARPSRPVAERIVQVGGFDALHGLHPGGLRWRPGELTRRDLIAQVGALERASATGVTSSRRRARRTGARGAAGATGTSTGAGAGGPPQAVQIPMSFTEHVEPGELPEMTEAEAVEAELEILGLDVSRHVIGFYDDLLDAIGVVRSDELLAVRGGAEILVAGVKVATQTPAVRSGQRVIFTTLDDSTGPIDLTFFESVQERCAATVFGSWMMVARGVVRRVGARAVSLRAVDCWNLAELDHLWRTEGLEAVRAVLGPGRGDQAGTGRGRRSRAAGARKARAEGDRAGVGGRPTEYGNGYRLSPYADIGPAPGVTTPPRKLWHASPGSSGPIGFIPRPDRCAGEGSAGRAAASESGRSRKGGR